MLDRSKTQILDTHSFPLHSTVVTSDIPGEGQAFVGVVENFVMKARPSRANATDVVLGISQLQERPFPTTTVIVEEVVVGAAGAATLARPAITAAGVLVKVKLTGETLVENGGAGDGQFNATDGSAALTFHSDEFNKTVIVTYRANLTAAEALAKNGDQMPGMAATLQLMNVNLITKGEVFTDMFDTNVDWANIDTTAAGELIKVTANGYISAGSGVTGSVIPGAYVTYAPTAEVPMLGIHINL